RARNSDSTTIGRINDKTVVTGCDMAQSALLSAAVVAIVITRRHGIIGTSLKTTSSDFLVVGGGIVGLATAWHLTRQFPDARICLLEKEPQVAQHQSGRNSGVLHSGIYYKPGSLKATTCRSGKLA